LYGEALLLLDVVFDHENARWAKQPFHVGRFCSETLLYPHRLTVRTQTGDGAAREPSDVHNN
jgi:hypothetical protein